jgi:hypothetical protein
MSSDKIAQQKKEDAETAERIANLKGIAGDKPTKISTTRPRSKKKSKNSAAAALKSLGNIFKKDNTDTDFVDPGISGAYDMPGVYDFTDNIVGGWKKGGRIKKSKIKKRAALRGQRSELRGS